MMKTLTRHGNSRALVIEKPILDLLKIDDTTPLEVTTDGKRLIITPLNDSSREALVAEEITKAHKQYGKALRNLAK